MELFCYNVKVENFRFSFIKSLIGGRYHQFAPLVTAPVGVEEVVLLIQNGLLGLQRTLQIFAEF
jgi:hypothetical protein